jgi:tetratricopeptide (TPR) repeat protein
MKYYIRTTLSVVLIIAINACNSQKTNHPVECIKLNDEGINYLMNYPMNGEKGLEKAIDLFKQAISCDSTNFIFYNNLANAYDQKHNYDGEMVVMNKMLALTANDPAILMQKGMLFEVMGRANSAKELYNLSKVEYEKRLAKRPNDINLIKGIVSLIGVDSGKEEAIKALNEQIKIHPELSPELSQQLLFYKYFNRHDFVFRLPTVTDLNK